MPRPSVCPLCDARAGISIEYGLPDEELIEQAGRGEVIIGGDLVFEGQPDWRCSACGHEWAAEVTPGGLRVVHRRDLSPGEYDEAVRILSECGSLTGAVCDALVATPGDYDTAGSRSAYRDLLEWLRREHPSASGVDAETGMYELVVPEGSGHLADVLIAANDVCVSLGLLYSGNLADYGRDIADELGVYRRRRDLHDTNTTEFDALFDELGALAAEAAREADQPGPDDGWSEVGDIADRVFGAGLTDGEPLPSEVAWARYAWGALGRAGLTAWRTEVERARVLVRLATLNALHQEFCARAFDEGRPGEWSVEVGDVVGEAPRIDPVVLGVLAEREGVDGEAAPARHALRELIRLQGEVVSGALLEELNAAVLFASLWESAQLGVGYPLPDSAVHAVVNTDVSGEKLYAWQWIDEGMSLG